MHLSHKISFSQMMLDTTTRPYLRRFSSRAWVCEEVAKLKRTHTMEVLRDDKTCLKGGMYINGSIFFRTESSLGSWLFN